MPVLAAENQDLRCLRLRNAGMFSNVNEVVEQLRRARIGGYRFVIDWQVSCYRDSARFGDPWGYYFAPCFEGLDQTTADNADLPVLPGGIPVACARDNIITPRRVDGQCNPLLLPRDRVGSHALIRDGIRVKANILERVAAFRKAAFRPQMIGLHIRGLGRTDGGVPELRAQYGLKDNAVPMQPFFDQVDTALAVAPEAGIFACSDSSVVLEQIMARYGDRVVSTQAQRSVFGEMHAGHPQNAGQRFLPYRLGLEVLCDALLLSHTDLFVHGNSNVANFVICAAPELRHVYVAA